MNVLDNYISLTVYTNDSTTTTRILFPMAMTIEEIAAVVRKNLANPNVRALTLMDDFLCTTTWERRTGAWGEEIDNVFEEQCAMCGCNDMPKYGPVDMCVCPDMTCSARTRCGATHDSADANGLVHLCDGRAVDMNTNTIIDAPLVERNGEGTFLDADGNRYTAEWNAEDGYTY